MKFMILVKSNPELEASIDAMSDADMKASLARMGTFNDELKEAGILKDSDGLRPSRDGKRVRFDGTSRQVVDGPFSGDLVAGYWIWEFHGRSGRLGEALPKPDASAVRDRDQADRLGARLNRPTCGAKAVMEVGRAPCRGLVH